MVGKGTAIAILLEVNPDNTPGGERTEESTSKEPRATLLTDTEKRNKAIAILLEVNPDNVVPIPVGVNRRQYRTASLT
jgi:hypothetical protein